MLEDSYLCEANIEAAQIMINREWEKSKTIKNPDNRALYIHYRELQPVEKNHYRYLSDKLNACNDLIDKLHNWGI